MLIQSIYTHLFKRDSHFYLYNSLQSFLAEIGEDLYEVLYNRDYDQLPVSVLCDLQKACVLVDESEKYNFFNESYVKFNASAYDTSFLSLVIVPTTSCNFCCPYCFEGDKVSKYMTEKVQDEIVNFVKNRPNLKKLSLTWYGGEPLMAFDRIKKLYARLSEITDIKIAGHSIVTNGYLVNENILTFMRESNIDSVQITLDGMKTHHNKMRALKHTNEPTYERIVDNIGLILENVPDCRLSVRVNISNENKNDYKVVSDELKQIYVNKRFSIYPGIIREYTSDDCSMSYKCLNGGDYFSFLKDSSYKGLRVNFMPRVVVHKGCMIHRANSLIIGPEGEVYKCWNDVNHPEAVIGYIQDKQFKNKSLYYNYMVDTTPFRSECRDCLLFPTCNGGCGYLISKNKRLGAKNNVCPAFKDKHVLEESLLSFLSRKGRDNDNIKFDLSI